MLNELNNGLWTFPKDSTFYANPWPHQIIDNYYSDELLASCKKELLSNIRQYRDEFVIKGHDNIFISANNLYENERFPQTMKLLHSQDVRSLLDGFTDHRDYTKLTRYGEAILCLKSADHIIHDEAEDKVLSTVTYLSPEIGEGTLLYDRQKKFSKQVEWKPNRTLVFAAKTGLTWHSYRSVDGIRLTLNSFLLR